jgi:hypothetical protein
MRQYFENLIDRFGHGWNEFWFRPSDPYSVGVIRLVTGVVALYWYLAYLPDLERLFGPNGLLPSELVDTYRFGKGWSYFDYLQTTSALWAGYSAGLIVLMLFTAGVFSRATSFLAWVVVLSMIQRGPMLAGPVEDVLAMVMLYLWIGPSGASCSIDSWLRRRSTNPGRLNGRPELSWSATVSIRLMQLHLSAVYFLMAIAKMKVDSWWSGTAVWWISASEGPRLVDLTWLAKNTFTTYIMNAWTHLIVFFELAFSLLVWNRLARPLMLAFAVPVWIGTAIVTDLFLFALMMLVANLAFLSSSALRQFVSRWTITQAARARRTTPETAAAR